VYALVRVFFKQALHPLTGTSLTKLLSEDEQTTFKEELVKLNLKRIIPVLMLMIVSQIINIVLEFTMHTHPKYSYYFNIATVYLIATILLYIPLVLTALSAKSKLKHRTRKCMISGFWLLFLLGMLGFSCIELIETNSLNNYIIMITFLSVFPIFNLLEITVYTVFNVAITISSIVLLKLPADNIPTIVVLSVISIYISQIFYSSHKKLYLEHKYLHEANEKLRLLNIRLEKLSETDDLTSLLNRRGMENRLEFLWAQCIRDLNNIAVLMIDIDFFKNYNDEYGHCMGDDCLSKVAKCIKDNAKRATDIVARYGGEEFIVVFNNIKPEHVVHLAKQIKDAIESMSIETTASSIASVITVSIGAAVIQPSLNNTYRHLIDMADIELYHAKESGRNCIVFIDELYF